MATRYISSKTAFLYKNKTGNARHYIFIHGDVVKTKGKPQGNPKNKRIKVSTRYSNVDGWVNEGSLVESPHLRCSLLMLAKETLHSSLPLSAKQF